MRSFHHGIKRTVNVKTKDIGGEAESHTQTVNVKTKSVSKGWTDTAYTERPTIIQQDEQFHLMERNSVKNT